jgi:peroxiredoxin
VDQLVELNENLSAFEKEGAVVIAAVTDPLEYSKKTAQENNIQFPIMYDPNHQLGSKYGVYNVPGGMDMGPVDTHSIFLIDKEGVVRWYEISPHEMYVPLDSILKELKKL